MKSILIGGPAIENVYTKETLTTLQTEAGLWNRILSKDDLPAFRQEAAEADFLFSTWGMPHFTEAEITQTFPKLKAVFYAAGSVQGFAREFLNSGIPVFSAWAANAIPVAEYTVAQIILANKGFFQACRKTVSPSARSKDASPYASHMPGNYGCKVGIIGAGMIGKLVIQRLREYHLEVLVFDPFLPDDTALELGVRKVSLEELFSSCQTISNHVANLPATVGMLHGGFFSLMRETATFINTGRGAQVVEKDLLQLLQEKPSITAILDVTMPEPPEEGSLFYSLPNVFLTPHIAGSSGDEVHRMGEYMLEEFRSFSAGAPTKYSVSLKMLETMA